MFLDALIISGSGPAALLIRDVVGEILTIAEETPTIARIIGPLPNYIRNPSESLLTEFEVCLKLANALNKLKPV